MSGAIPTYLRRTEIPVHFPVSLRTVDEWIAQRAIAVIRNGRRVIIRADVVAAKLDGMSVSAAPRRGRPRKGNARA